MWSVFLSTFLSRISSCEFSLQTFCYFNLNYILLSLWAGEKWIWWTRLKWNWMKTIINSCMVIQILCSELWAFFFVFLGCCYRRHRRLLCEYHRQNLHILYFLVQCGKFYDILSFHFVSRYERRNHALGPHIQSSKRKNRKENKNSNTVSESLRWRERESVREKQTKEMAYITLRIISKITIFFSLIPCCIVLWLPWKCYEWADYCFKFKIICVCVRVCVMCCVPTSAHTMRNDSWQCSLLI